jgi:hypothetical protein
VHGWREEVGTFEGGLTDELTEDGSGHDGHDKEPVTERGPGVQPLNIVHIVG